MNLLVLGISHQTASVALRETVHFPQENMEEALSSLLELSMVNGGVILSTCNRTEIYVSSNASGSHQKTLQNWLSNYHAISPEKLNNVLYYYENDEAIAHLMQVVSGLDSLILGEPQILGQVKKAYQSAQELNKVSSVLARLFQKSFFVAKRVRSETDIGANAVSIAYASSVLAKQIFESFSQLTTLLIGAGEMIELVARHLCAQNVGRLIIANRTLERAQLIAETMHAKAITHEQLDDYLPQADIVISSTASPIPVITKEKINRALKQRRHRPMLLIDIAVPRDIEPDVASLNGVYLYTIDDLKDRIQENLSQREKAAIEAREIVIEEKKEFLKWLNERQSTEAIRLYRTQSENIKEKLLKEALSALKQGKNVDDTLQELAHKLTNRLMHTPTKLLRDTMKLNDLSELPQMINNALLDKKEPH